MKHFTITYEVHTLEDFHSGDGLSKIGVYDSGQQAEFREGIRIPIIRDDTVRGLIRDSCQRLMDSTFYKTEWKEKFSNKLEDVFNCLFNYTSGDSLFITSWRLKNDSFDSIKEKGKSAFRTISQTAIDFETKRAKEHSLRRIECGRKGLNFTGEIQGRVDDNLLEACKKLLIDGLKSLRRFGGRRRRGFGRIQIKNISNQDSPQNSPNKNKGTKLDNETASKDEKKILLLFLEALEPIQIVSGTQYGNIVPTLDFIPGSTLLGAFRHEWRLELRNSSLSNEVKEFLLDHSNVSFGNAYPLPLTDKSIDKISQLPKPVPLSWQFPKGEKGSSLKERKTKFLLWEEKDERREREKPLKRYDGYYYQGNNVYKPEIESVMRNKIDPQKGIVDEGNLFTAEYLCRGTRFVSEIRFEKAEDLNIFIQAFSYLFSDKRWLGIGRGRKPVKVKYHVLSAFNKQDLDPPDSFVLHLDSDLLCYSDFLTYNLDIEDILRKSLGEASLPYKLKRRFERVREFRTFSPLGGLPAFPKLLLQKGNSYLFHKTGKVSDAKEFWQRLYKLQYTGGLGHGQNIGFGRFSLERKRPDFTELKNLSLTLKKEVPFVRSSSREAIIREAKQEASSIKKEDFPSATQWNNLLRELRWGREVNKILEKDPWKDDKKKHKVNTWIEKYKDKKDLIFFIESIIRWIQVDKIEQGE